MYTRRYTLFHLFGFAVRLDLSWLILALLVTWTLAIGLFPTLSPGLSRATYWSMGVVGMIGLFISIVLHELSHALVARAYKLPIRGITLFVFGGVSEMAEEPRDAKTELLMAAAGPITSFLLALIFYVWFGFTRGEVTTPLNSVLYYLSFINFALGVFNLIPGFPLDGGRVLRAALWAWKRDLRWATRIAARSGSIVGLALIFLGAFSFIGGNILSGMWWFLIGLFLRNAAGMSYQQLLIRESIQGEPVRRFMNPHPVTISPNVPLQTLVDNYIYQHHHKAYPVVDHERLIGIVGMDQIKAVPRAEWTKRTVADAMQSNTAEDSVGPDTDALQAWQRMSHTGRSRLLVLDHGRLVGILGLRDLLNFLSVKFDLEGAKV